MKSIIKARLEFFIQTLSHFFFFGIEGVIIFCGKSFDLCSWFYHLYCCNKVLVGWLAYLLSKPFTKSLLVTHIVYSFLPTLNPLYAAFYNLCLLNLSIIAVYFSLDLLCFFVNPFQHFLIEFQQKSINIFIDFTFFLAMRVYIFFTWNCIPSLCPQ